LALFQEHSINYEKHDTEKIRDNKVGIWIREVSFRNVKISDGERVELMCEREGVLDLSEVRERRQKGMHTADVF
jgi:putative ubiquitin-RnfH superfamily antitoxin RatB of RatAB toxin-antitoxin module